MLGPRGEAVKPVGAAFPKALVGSSRTKCIDRRVLGALVFKDKAALRRLEGILHPLVRAGERQFLANAQKRRCHLVVLDVPLLFETGGEARCDSTAVVSAPLFIQRARVLGRGGMSTEKFAGINARQMPDWEKRRRAEFVIPTGLDRRVSLRAVHAITRILRERHGTHWPRCWPAANTVH